MHPWLCLSWGSLSMWLLMLIRCKEREELSTRKYTAGNRTYYIHFWQQSGVQPHSQVDQAALPIALHVLQLDWQLNRQKDILLDALLWPTCFSSLCALLRQKLYASEQNTL